MRRAINERSTVGITMGIKLSSGVFKIPGLSSLSIQTGDFTPSGFRVIPEYRWYFQETERSYMGFYIGGYYKYQVANDNVNGVYTSSSGSVNDIDLDFTVNTHAIGFQVGYKIPIRKRLFVDFIIAGPGVSLIGIDVELKQSLPEAFYEDLGISLIDNLGILDSFDVNINFSGNGNKRNDLIIIPALRYGIKIGYSF